jgi:hypothetical protein
LVLLVVSAGFRKLALGLVVIALVGGAIATFYSYEEEKESLTRIPASQVGLENMQLNPNYGGYKLSGRIKNNSGQFTLNRIVLAVTMQDCGGEAAAQNCVTIAESQTSPFLTIPPGQARDFQETVYFSGGTLKPKGRLDWRYSVSQTRGK